MSRWVIDGAEYRVTPPPREWSVNGALYKARWSEDDHPRDWRGRFARGRGTGPDLPGDLATERAHNRAAVDQWWNGLDGDQRAGVRATIAAQAAKPLRINASEQALRSVLTDGRFKTVHEVAPEQAGMRRAYEDAALGADGAGPDTLPVYGFAGDVEDLDAYGDYSVVLRESARRRATATVGDSLNSVLEPQPLTDLTDLDDNRLLSMIGRSNTAALPAGSILDYLEVQIPGVPASDIAAVDVPADAPDDLVSALEARGIKVRRKPDPDDEFAELFARIAAAGKTLNYALFPDGSRADGIVSDERSPVTVTTASGRKFTTTWGAVLAQTGGAAATLLQRKAVNASQISYKVRRRWRPELHPRDRRGRFIETGDPVTLLGGARGTFQGVDARSGRFRVRVGDTERLVQRSHVTFDDRGSAERANGRPAPARETTPAPTAPAPTPTPAPAAAPAPPPAPPTGQVATGKATLVADSQRNSINSLDIDAPDSGWPPAAREGAAALRAKQPMTADQADALADAVRLAADFPGVPKTKRNSLLRGADRLNSLSARLRGFGPGKAPTTGQGAVKVTPSEVEAGDFIAFPGPGGAVEVREVVEAADFFGDFKFTLKNSAGATETRYVYPDTDLRRFTAATSVADALAMLDAADGKPGKPAALYDDPDPLLIPDDFDDPDVDLGPQEVLGSIFPPGPKVAAKPKKVAAKKPGTTPSPAPTPEPEPAVNKSGAVGPYTMWFDHLALSGDNTTPIPVSGLTIEGYTVNSGIAWRSKGRTYLVELKPGETEAQAHMRGSNVATLMESVLKSAPPDKAKLQRGLAVLQGSNPADSYWAEKYNLSGFHSTATGQFGGTTIWGGHDPKPTDLAHEFGHIVDSQAFGTNQWLSDADGPVVPGQQLSWKDAQIRDKWVTEFYQNRFSESAGLNPSASYTFYKPITLNSVGVTSYGSVDPREDFAESMRLWMKQRREGHIGTDTQTGDKIHFSDLFPERARILDAVMGVKTDFGTPAFKRRFQEIETAFLEDLKRREDDPSLPELSLYDMANSGLRYDDVADARVSAQEKYANWKKSEEEKKKAAELAAKVAAEKAAAEAKAMAEVETVTKALEAGKLDKADAKAFRLKVTLYKNKLRDQGYSEFEIAQMAAAYETALMHQHFKLGQYALPKLSPNFSSKERTAAYEWFHGGSHGQHPLAEKQWGEEAQLAANINAELADRLNNPDDWARFRAYKIASGEYGAKDPGSFESLTPKQRHDRLSEEVSARIGLWASTSGDSSDNAVLMQEAVKQEFNLPQQAASAPNMDETQFNNLMQQRWATTGPWYQRVARVIYEHTQDEFKKAGITRVSLYRGMKFYSYGGKSKPDWAKSAGAKRVPLQPINSWSTNKGTSTSFAGSSGVLLKASVPVELVLSAGRTGFGTMFEDEFVVFDNDGDIQVEML